MGFARASESVFPMRTNVARRPGGMDRRSPQRPREERGVLEGGTKSPLALSRGVLEGGTKSPLAPLPTTPNASRRPSPAPRERQLAPRAAVLCGLSGIVLAIAVIGVSSYTPAAASTGRQSIQTSAPAPSRAPTPAPGPRWPWS